MALAVRTWVPVGVVAAMSVTLAAPLLPASAAVPQELSIVTPDKVALTSGDSRLKATIVVLNAGPETSVSFRVDADKQINVSPATAIAKANDVTRIPVTFSPADSGTKKATGQLIATAGGRPPAAVGFELAQKLESPDWALLVLFAPLVAAAIFVCIAWLSLSGKQPRLGSRLGPADWDISKSYASNLTVFSALLGTILSAGVLPEDLPKDRVATYAGLNLLFGVAVIAGPFLYTAFQRPKAVNRRSAVKEPQYQGYVWTFLLAGTVTVWATAGEFATIAKLFSEIRTGKSLPGAAAIAFEVLVVVAGLALIVLTWTRTRTILSDQVEARTPARKRRMRELLHGDGVQGLTEDGFEPELEAWKVF